MILTNTPATEQPDHGDEIITRLTVDFLMDKLTPMEQEIWFLRAAEDRKYEEIAEQLGPKYWPEEGITGSAIRYHMGQIKRKLEQYRDASI